MIEIMAKVNGDTKIVNEYFDMDKKEFVSKCELIKRFIEPTDYYTKVHSFESASNEHKILWVFSKRRFGSSEAFLAIKEAVGLR